MSEVNYLLLFKGNGDHGGSEASVRSFSMLKSVQCAMDASYKRLAASMNIPVSVQAPSNRYTIRTKNSIRLERYGDVFQWDIIKAEPEDGEQNGVSVHGRRFELRNFTVIVEERTTRKFQVEAYDIFRAIQSVENEYKREPFAVSPSGARSRLIMAFDKATGESTVWKEF